MKGQNGEPFSIMNNLKDGKFQVNQALVSGCAGEMFENIAAMANILDGCAISGNKTGIGINPSSQTINLLLMQQGILDRLMIAGASVRLCICGPCFGVTDVPANNQVSIRHTTRNYPNCEGSITGQGQLAATILMDTRSIAATVRQNGILTAATELDIDYTNPGYQYNAKLYENQVYDNYEKTNPKHELKMGPNISDWPDVLIPSGDASSYRSNPHKISEYMMMSRDSEFVQ